MYVTSTQKQLIHDVVYSQMSVADACKRNKVRLKTAARWFGEDDFVKMFCAERKAVIDMSDAVLQLRFASACDALASIVRDSPSLPAKLTAAKTILEYQKEHDNVDDSKIMHLIQGLVTDCAYLDDEPQT